MTKLDSSRRRRYYATKVRTLTFSDLDRCLRHGFPPRPPATELIPLPKLRQLELNVYVGVEVDRKWLLTLVAAVAGQLTHLHLDCGEAWLMDMLDALRDADAPLRQLSLVVPKSARPLNAARFLRYLETCSPPRRARPLASLTMTGKASAALLSRPALTYLANRAGLQHLVLQRRLAEGSVRPMLLALVPAAPERAPFANLAHLSLVVTARAVPLLALFLGQLRRLALSIPDAPPRSMRVVLPAVAPSLGRRLRSLDICYHGRAFVPLEDLLALQSLPELQQLVLAPPKKESFCYSTYIGPAVSLQPVSSTQFAHLLHAIGAQLRTLVLWALLSWHTMDALRAVGRACRVLETLALAGRHDLRKLGTWDQPLYRPLRKLHLGKMYVAEIDALDNST